MGNFSFTAANIKILFQRKWDLLESNATKFLPEVENFDDHEIVFKEPLTFKQLGLIHKITFYLFKEESWMKFDGQVSPYHIGQKSSDGETDRKRVQYILEETQRLAFQKALHRPNET